MHPCIARCLILAAMVLAANVTFAKDADDKNAFRIRAVDGTVYYKLPLSAKWQVLVKDLKLPAGSLVQVGQNSTVDFSFYFRHARGWDGEETIIKVKTPTNFVLDQEVLRTVEMSNLFMDRIPEVKEYDRQGTMDDYFPFLKYAWDRIGMYITRNDTNANYVDELFKNADSQSIEVGVRSSKLKLLYPDHGDAEFVPFYPAEVEIVWERSARNPGPYQIYTWPSSEPRGEPVATTKETAYAVSFNEPGSYYVQVATTDKRAWSGAHIFHLSEPMTVPKSYFESNALTLLTPPTQYTFVSNNPALKTHFSWERQAGIEFVSLDLVLQEGTKKPRIIKIAPGQNDLVRTLRPGTYKWHMKGQIRADIGNSVTLNNQIESPVRTFVITKGSYDDALARLSTTLNAKKPKASHTIFTE